MIIEKVILKKIRLTFRKPFEISSGRMADRDTILVYAYTKDGILGVGEAPTLSWPIYSSDFTDAALLVLKQFLVPAILGKELHTIEDFYQCHKNYKGHNMSRTGIEAAFWHIRSQEENKSLGELWGGTRKEIPVGVSLGLESSAEKILEKASHWVEEEKSMRIKIKVKPGMDIEPVRLIKEKYPDVSLMLDANSAYTLKDIDVFKELDQYNLLMIEQPLAEDDIIDHAALQKKIKTPICLDESIHSLEDTRKAIEMDACKIINIKPPRVGGFWRSKQIAEYCEKHDIAVWCGGMMESGWGRSFNIQISSLANYQLPADICKTTRYFTDDIIDPFIEVKENSHIHVPQDPGNSHFKLREKVIDKLTVDEIEVTKN